MNNMHANGLNAHTSDTIQGETATAAVEYVRKGWRPIPIKLREKRPLHKEWEKLVITEEQVPHYFGGQCNVGIRLGEPSNNLVDIDLDCPEANALAPNFLPATLTFGRTSTPASHWLYTSPNAKTKRFQAPDGSTLVELRSTGMQTVVPPSIHKTNEPVAWSRIVAQPLDILADELATRVAWLAAGCLLKRYYPGEGSRQEAALAISGFLLTNGVGVEDTCDFLETIATIAGDDQVKMRLGAVKSSAKKIEAGGQVVGAGALAKIFGKDVVEKLREWLGFRTKQGSPGGFACDAKGAITANHQKNIRRALELLEVAVSFDRFADRLLLTRGTADPILLDDSALDRLWLEIDETFRFRPGYGFFQKVVEDFARANGFHPVCDYLNGLTWDGEKRIDQWLIKYGGAGDSVYTRSVGALVLIAAVRRVRQPGSKFDELLVLESTQGTDKSSALVALCPKQQWFTDDLPLSSTSKEVIERTSGKWIIEAGELAGLAKREIEHLKAFLSRQVDNARLSYGRLTTERPRHFVVIGTTNSDAYLRDATGNRRFWPVRVLRFDVERLRADRDQLWAEAAQREAQGESIRLNPTLYETAQVQQDRRRIQDPWEEQVDTVVGDRNGKIAAVDAWLLVGAFDPSRRNQSDNTKLGESMRRCGFIRKKAKINGRTVWCYVRGTDEDQERRICVELERDHNGRAVAGGTIAIWVEGLEEPPILRAPIDPQKELPWPPM